jgi:serine O-acetyltransferase
MTIEQELQAFISREVVVDTEEKGEVQADEPLLSSGRVDSLGLLQVLGYVKQRYGVTLIEEGTPRDFQTIDALAAAIRAMGGDAKQGLPAESPLPKPTVRAIHPKPRVTARQAFRADFARYLPCDGRTGRLVEWATLLEARSSWAVGWFRFGQYLRNEAPAWLRSTLAFPYSLVHQTLQLALGIHIYPETEIGPGLYIGNIGGVWISTRAKIGSHCNINHGVTIGVAGQGPGAPTLGDRVWVGPGAVVTGAVKVGSGAEVGANSVVVEDVPEGARVLGIPARIIRPTGSEKSAERGDVALRG